MLENGIYIDDKNQTYLFLGECASWVAGEPNKLIFVSENGSLWYLDKISFSKNFSLLKKAKSKFSSKETIELLKSFFL